MTTAPGRPAMTITARFLPLILILMVLIGVGVLRAAARWLS